MKQILFFSLLAILFLSADIQQEERDPQYIYWDERPVTWDDFKGRAPGNSPYVALTYSAINFSYSGEGSNLDLEIHTIFDPKQSWKKKNVTDFVLKHEQGHFDITEIYARVFRKEIQSYKFKKLDSIDDEMQKVFMKNFDACGKFQDKYDKETDHSKIEKEQLRWNDQISTMLDSLKDYANPVLKLDIGYLY